MLLNVWEDRQRVRQKRSPVRLDTFSGNTPLQVFLNKVDSARRYNNWSDEDCLVQVKSVLREGAANILMQYGSANWTWLQLRSALESRFGSEGQAKRYR